MSLEHGAVIDQVYEAYGVDKPQQVLDFSTNTNVVVNEGIDIHGLIMELLADEVALKDYPDSDGQALRDLLGCHLGLEPENLLPVNGSNQAVYLIASYLQGKTVAILEPAYPEYETALLVYGAEVRYVFDMQELEELIEQDLVDAAFICNPNNPTGEYHEYDRMLSLAKAMSNRKAMLVIDEAYVDFFDGAGG